MENNRRVTRNAGPRSKTRRSPSRKSPDRKSSTTPLDTSSSPESKRRGRPLKSGGKSGNEESSSSSNTPPKLKVVAANSAAELQFKSITPTVRLEKFTVESLKSMEKEASVTLTKSNFNTMTMTNVTSTSSSSSTTTSGGANKLTIGMAKRPPLPSEVLDSIDIEVAKFTASANNGNGNGNSEHVSVSTPAPSNSYTPTHTDASTGRRSASRSMSRSLFDDHLTHTEFSDQEDEDGDDALAEDEYRDIDLDRSFVPLRESRGSSYSRRSVSRRRQFGEVVEFGGTWGAVALLLLWPTFGLGLHCWQTPAKCAALLAAPTASSIVALAYTAYAALVFLAGAFPFGRSVQMFNDRGLLQYHYNAIGCVVVAAAAIIGAEYAGYRVTAFVLSNYTRFCAAAIAHAIVAAGWCYVRANYAPAIQWNPFARSGNRLADFFVGREVNPRWFRLVDIKLAHNRCAIVSAALLAGILVKRNLRVPILPATPLMQPLDAALHVLGHLEYNPTSLMAAVLPLVYALDLIVNEHHLTSSFEIQSEGVGAGLLLRYALFPFMTCFVAMFAATRKIVMPPWAIALTVIVFVAGICVKRAAMAMKYKYRMNPMHPALVFLDSVPTFQGRRLLTAKWWGIVRHPNYIGDIVVHLAFAAPLIWHFAWPPACAILYTIVMLVHRAIRVNARNGVRYNSAWTRYTERIKYMLVPKVF